MATPVPSRLSDADLAALSRFDYVSEESLAALSRLDAGTRSMVIQSCTTDPRFDDVDLYYLAMSELSDLQLEAEAATAAAVVADANADHQDARESTINMETPLAATAASSSWVPKGRESSNRIRRPVVSFPVDMKDYPQRKPVRGDSDTLQWPPFNMTETRASSSGSTRPTMPTGFDNVYRKLPISALDTDQERATTTTMIAKRTTKKRAATKDEGKATGRGGRSSSSTTDERFETKRSITASKLMMLAALTESLPPAPPDQVCHNQETTLAIADDCEKTVINKTKVMRLPLKKRPIDFEYQEDKSGTATKKRVIKPETPTPTPPTAPPPPEVCCNQETALAIADDERLTVKKARRACGMKRAIDFVYGEEEDPSKASTSSKKRVIKKKSTSENNVVQPPHQPPDLPAELRERIIALQGTDPVLVIQKALYSTDVNPVQCRLSMPLTKVNREFLSPEETATLSTRRGSDVPEIKVQLIEPSGHVREMSLKKWDMKKESGTVNSTYNLVSGWKDVVRDNDLQAGMIMQLWSFQVGSQRWFALVKVESDEGH